jgi:hypothetical protein
MKIKDAAPALSRTGALSGRKIEILAEGEELAHPAMNRVMEAFG